MWAECRDCGEEFYREQHEHWKRYCLECWLVRKRREQEAELGDLETRLAQLEETIDFILTGISTHWSFLIRKAHPDLNGGSRQSAEATKWLLDDRALSQNHQRFLG